MNSRLCALLFVIAAFCGAGTLVSADGVATEASPLKFGVPCQEDDASVKTKFEDYFTELKTADGYFIEAVCSFGAIGDLKDGKVDVAEMDAVAAGIGHKRYKFNLVASEILQGQSSAKYKATAWVRKGSGIKTFADLKGKRSCHTGFLKSAGMFMPVSYALNEKVFEVVGDVNAPVDACNSPLKSTVEAFFSKSCAVGSKKGEVSICSGCSGTTNRYECNKNEESISGYGGSLSGLFSDNCDVAFARTTTVEDYCGSSVTDKPSWCSDKDTIEELDELKSKNTRLGEVPGHGFLIAEKHAGGSSYTSDDIRKIENVIIGLKGKDLLKYYGSFSGVEILSTEGTSRSEATTMFYKDYMTSLDSLPGVTNYLECKNGSGDDVECHATPSFCNDIDSKGKKLNPVVFGVKEAVTDKVREYFAEIGTKDDLYMTAFTLPSSFSPVTALGVGHVDIAEMDSSLAWVGSKTENLKAFAVEKKGTSTSYVATAWVKKSAKLSTFKELNNKRSCHTGFLKSAGMFMPVGWAIKNTKDTGMVALGNSNTPIDHCNSPLKATVAEYFSSTCAPASTKNEVGVCSGCSSSECSIPDGKGIYSGYDGAIRQLVKGECDVAFAKSTTFEDFCKGSDKKSWCPENIDDYETLSTLGETGFGNVPNHPLMASPTVMSSSTANKVIDKVQAFPDYMVQLFGEGIEGYTKIGDKTPGTDAATDELLQSFGSNLDNVPGLTEEYLQCSKSSSCVLEKVDYCHDISTKGKRVGNPIVIGLPGVDKSLQSEFIKYFKTKESDVFMDIYPFSTSTTEVNKGLVDVVDFDSSAAYVAWKAHSMQVLAVEVTDSRERNEGYQAVAYVKKDSGLGSFADLKGKKSCHTGMLKSAGMYYPIGYAVANSKITGFETVNGDANIVACESSLKASVENFFDKSCAPAKKSGQSGICELCGESTGCDSSDSYAGYDGAVSGLVDGVCDVAFARDTTLEDYCKGNDKASWCSKTDELKILPLEGDNNNSFGVVPNHPLMIRGDISSSTSETVANVLVGMSNDLIKGFQSGKVLELALLSGVVPGTTAASSKHLASMKTIIDNVPGLNAYLTCTDNGSCAAVPENCSGAPGSGDKDDTPNDDDKPNEEDNGTLKVKLGFPGLNDETVKTFNEFYGKAENNLGLDVTVVTENHNHVEALEKGLADVMYYDGADARVALKQFKHEMIALETPEFYKPMAWVRSDRTNIVKKFSELRGLRSCHTGFAKSAGMLMPIGWALRNEAVTGMKLVGNNDVPLFNCDSPLKTTLRSFFDRSCAPGSKAGGVAICDFCWQQNSCSGIDAYGGYFGALKGLDENRCDVAFVKDSTPEDLCKAEPESSACKNKDKFVRLEEVQEDGFGRVPSHSYWTKPNKFTSDQNAQITDVLKKLLNDEELKKAVGSSFEGIKRADISGEEHMRSYSENLDNVPGLVAAETKCESQSSNADCSQSWPGMCWVSNSKGEEGNPLVFALPDSTSASELSAARQHFKAEAAANGVYMDAAAVPSGVKALEKRTVDVVVVDALEGYTGMKSHKQKVVAVEENPVTKTPFYTPTAFIRKPTSRRRASSKIENFGDLKGLRSCHTGFLKSAGMFFPTSYAIRKGYMAVYGDQNVGIDQCTSPVKVTIESFFSKSCAPPKVEGMVGIVEGCAQTDGGLDATNRYAGYFGAIRGLLEFACDVAFVKSTTLDEFCALPENSETCKTRDELTILPEVSANGFGKVPSHAYMVNEGQTDKAVQSITNRLKEINSSEELQKIFGRIVVDESRSLDERTEDHLGGLKAIVDNVPGLEAFEQCTSEGSCTTPTDCTNERIGTVNMEDAPGDSSDSDDGNGLAIGLGIGIPIAVILLALFGYFMYRKYKKDEGQTTTRTSKKDIELVNTGSEIPEGATVV
eukprot:Nk52_evm17s1400 gene=Nk52_evmTU17s1400